MRVQVHLSEDEMKLAIAHWLSSMDERKLNKIKPDAVVITHCTVSKSGEKRDSYGASISYEKE